MTKQFSSPQDAEDAFYDAFEANDLEAMMSVWADAEDIVCIQPMSPIFQGPADIGRTWEQVFSHDKKPEIMVYHHQWIENEGIAVHIVEEQISLPGIPQQPPPVIATNGYRRESSGWRMVLHHVSLPPPPPGPFGMQPPAPPAKTP